MTFPDTVSPAELVTELRRLGLRLMPAGAAMAISSAFVVTISLRLRRVQPLR